MVRAQSDSRPLHLPGVKKDEFVQFLKAMFPRYARAFYIAEVHVVLKHNMCRSRFPTRESMSVQEWTTVLRLASMWGFDGLRRICLHHISALKADPVLKLAVSLEYNVPKLFLPAAIRIAAREDPISVHDVELIGVDAALKLSESVGATLLAPAMASLSSTRAYLAIPITSLHSSGTSSQHRLGKQSHYDVACRSSR